MSSRDLVRHRIAIRFCSSGLVLIQLCLVKRKRYHLRNVNDYAHRGIVAKTIGKEKELEGRSYKKTFL